MSWLAVHTKPREEATASAQLQQQGYGVFLPEITERKRRKGKWQRVRSPLFPRYLFINVDLEEQSIAPVRSTRGVIGLLRFGGEIAVLPNTVVEALQAAHEFGAEADTSSEQEWPHKPGDTVEILEGPFKGLAAVYQMPKGEDRAALLLTMLGSEQTVVVERSSLGSVIESAS
ncbi:MAG: transcription/translation regulatory transformer protein RfaH [Halioglobus sp.]